MYLWTGRVHFVWTDCVCSGSFSCFKIPAFPASFQPGRLKGSGPVSCSSIGLYGPSHSALFLLNKLGEHYGKLSFHLLSVPSLWSILLSPSLRSLPVDVCQAVCQSLGEEEVAFTTVSVCRVQQFLFQRIQQRSHWVGTKSVLEDKTSYLVRFGARDYIYCTYWHLENKT